MKTNTLSPRYMLTITMLLCGLFSTLRGQEPQAQTRAESDQVIRVQVETVPLSVTVVDNQGNPILDLKPEDFEVRVDGKKVNLLNFSLVSLGQPTQEFESADGRSPDSPQTVAASESADPGSTPTQQVQSDSRAMIILLGRGRRYFNGVQAISDWIKNQVRPGDRLAILMLNRLSDLTSDHDKILGFLERYDKFHQKLETEFERMNSILPLARDLFESMSKCRVPNRVVDWVDELFRESELASQRIIPSIHLRPAASRADYGLRRGSFGLQGDTDSFALQRSLEARQSGTAAAETDRLEFEQEEQIARSGLPKPVYNFRRGMAMMDICGISAAIEHLRFMEGEKAVVYFNAGGLLTATERDSRMIRSASSARVRIFAIQNAGFGFHFGENAILTGGVNPRGLITGSEFVKTRSPHIFSGRTDQVLMLGALEQMAEGSGGKAFLTKRPEVALREVDTLTSSYYLLGFEPAQDYNGQFRKIEVKVKRKGARVQHRRGFYAEPPPTSEELKSQLVRSRITNAAYHPDFVNDLRFEFELGRRDDQAKPSSSRQDQSDQDVEGAGQVRLRFAMTPPDSIFSKADEAGQEERTTGELMIGYFVLSPKTERAWMSFDRIGFKLDEQQLEQLRQDGFELQKSFDVPEEFTSGVFKVVVYDPKSDRLGSAATAFERE
ncbi:MAG TPA: VWA domain-containing protein [Acidobacteriota bacterium]|nr:VWA domain-containing protein [Acidobacteriota bacterium]